jgi:predicted metalloprotease
VIRRIAAAVVAVLALSACPDEVIDDPPEAFTTTTTSTSVPVLGEPEPVDPPLKVRRDVAGLTPVLNEFWERQMQSLYGVQWRRPSVVREYDEGNEVECARSLLAENNAWYCPADHSVSYDISWFSGYVERHPGGATTFLILAHEFGHAAQELWVRSGGGDSWNPPYRKEIGADCLAGAFLIDAINNGSITEEEGDAEAIFGWLYETGSEPSPWLAPGTHGTKEQRQQAFVDGLQQGVDYCRKTY